MSRNTNERGAIVPARTPRIFIWPEKFFNTTRFNSIRYATFEFKGNFPGKNRIRINNPAPTTTKYSK